MVPLNTVGLFVGSFLYNVDFFLEFLKYIERRFLSERQPEEIPQKLGFFFLRFHASMVICPLHILCFYQR